MNQLLSLQDLAVLRSEARHEVQGFDCRFCKDPAAISQEMLQLESSTGKRTSVGTWLLSFFKYFGTEQLGLKL